MIINELTCHIGQRFYTDWINEEKYFALGRFLFVSFCTKGNDAQEGNGRLEIKKGRCITITLWVSIFNTTSTTMIVIILSIKGDNIITWIRDICLYISTTQHNIISPSSLIPLRGEENNWGLPQRRRRIRPPSPRKKILCVITSLYICKSFREMSFNGIYLNRPRK